MAIITYNALSSQDNFIILQFFVKNSTLTEFLHKIKSSTILPKNNLLKDKGYLSKKLDKDFYIFCIPKPNNHRFFTFSENETEEILLESVVSIKYLEENTNPCQSKAKIIPLTKFTIKCRRV